MKTTQIAELVRTRIEEKIQACEMKKLNKFTEKKRDTTVRRNTAAAVSFFAAERIRYGADSRKAEHFVYRTGAYHSSASVVGPKEGGKGRLAMALT